MIKLQFVSDISGRWDVDSIPIGWRATHEDFDGAEDALDDRSLTGKLLDDLIGEIKEWEAEQVEKEEYLADRESDYINDV